MMSANSTGGGLLQNHIFVGFATQVSLFWSYVCRDMVMVRKDQMIWGLTEFG